MSEIKFSADLDTSKLESAIKQSNATIGDWARGVEKAGTQADQGFGKMTRSLKDAIREQKDLIKTIEGDVKRLQKAFDDATAGRGKQSAYNELKTAKRALAEEQATLIDLQKQQIEANNGVEGSQSGVVSSLGKWALGLITVGAAMKVFKAIMESTETTSHALHSAINGLKSSTDYLLKSIATADFSNLIEGMREAFKAGREYTKEQEHIDNIRREFAIREADINKEIEEQRRIFYEDDKTSNDEKIKAGDKMLSKMKEKADMEIELAIKSYEAVVKLEKTKSKMSEDDIRYAIENYRRVNDIGNAYNKLNSLVKQYNEGVGKGLTVGGDKSKQYVQISPASPYQVMTKKNLEEIKREIDDLGPDAARLGAIQEAFGRMTKKERQVITDSIVDVKRAENQYNVESKRVFRMQQNLIDQANKDSVDIKGQIQKQQALLDEAIQKGDSEATKAIADKIVLLEKELSLRNDIAKAALLAAYGGDLSKVDTGDLKIPTFFTGTRIQDNGLVGMTPEQAKAKKKEYDETARQRQWNIDDAENDERKKRDQKEILKGATDLTYQLGVQLGLSKEQLDTLGAELDAFSQLAAGNYIGAAVSLLSQLMASFPSQTEKFANEVERLNRAIEQQQRIIDRSERFGGTAAALEDKIELLKQQADATIRQAMIMAGKGQGSAAAELIQQYKDIKAAIEDTNQELDDFYTGGITENIIADTIAKGFQEGKTSVDDFGNYMNDVLTEAIMNIFKSKLLNGPWIKAYTDQVEKALSDDVLTDEEKEGLAKMAKFISGKYEGPWNDLTQGLDMNGAMNKGLSGQIQRSITEETGTELAGLFRRFADDERAVKDYTLMGVNHLVGIEANTMNTVLELQKANVKLDTVISNTKQVPTAAI